MSSSRLLPEITASPKGTIPAVSDIDIDLEQVASIALIRQHAKCDDVPRVTDDLIRLYRRSAFEAAEQYTGLSLTKTRSITEVVPRNSLAQHNGRRNRAITLRFPSMDPVVYLYGSSYAGDHALDITPGTRKLTLPHMFCMPDFSPCCDPCRRIEDGGMRILYRTGFADCAAIPSGIILGALKFIAWSINNAGDEILTVRNRVDTSSTGIIGTNNVALASGALEMWRQYAQGQDGI